MPGGLQLRGRRLTGIALHVLCGIRVDGLGQHVLLRHGGHLCVVSANKQLYRRQRAADQRVAIAASDLLPLALEHTVSRHTLQCAVYDARWHCNHGLNQYLSRFANFFICVMECELFHLLACKYS